MAATDAITLAEAKAALNITGDGVVNDVELGQVVSAATALVEEWVGPLVIRSFSESLDGGSGEVWLTNEPVSVTSVTEYVGTSGTALTAEAAGVAGGYLADGRALYRRTGAYDRAWRYGRRNVAVTYTAGRYADTASVGPLAKEATVICLVHLWQHRGAGSGAGIQGGDGPAFGAVPFSSDVLRKKIRALMPNEVRGPGIA